MSALAKVSAINFQPAAVPATEWGNEPELKWLPLDTLRVDHSYQRDILATGRTTIRRIVQEFRWSRFGQIVVSLRPNGVYAIVDGQHRAAACLILGIAKVPCLIVTCELEEEAEAFAAINGNVTRPSGLQIYHARLVAGDRKARKLRSVCEAAGVSVPRQAVICDQVGMCTAIGALESSLQKYGEDVLTRALKLLVETGGGNVGLLRPPVISGLCDVLVSNPRLVARPGDLREALEAASVEKLYAKAKRIQDVDGGSVRGHFAAAVTKALESAMAKAA